MSLMSMTTDYRFISIPAPAIVMTLSDGKRQLSVTEPIPRMAKADMSRLQNSDPFALESFFSAHPAIRAKLDSTASILSTALRNIDTASTAVDRPTGILEYLRDVLRQETALAGNRRTSKVSKYRASINTLARFLGDRGRSTETLANLDADMISDFDRWMQRRDISIATREFYLRRLLALYHRAVREGILLDARPFDPTLRALKASTLSPLFTQ